MKLTRTKRPVSALPVAPYRPAGVIPAYVDAAGAVTIRYGGLEWLCASVDEARTIAEGAGCLLALRGAA